MAKQLNIGFVGCGGMTQSHLPGVKADPDVTITGFCDLRLELAQQRVAENGGKAYDDAAAMFDDAKLDAVYLNLPPFAHGVEFAAIERGIWVMAAAGNLGPDPGTVMSPACEPYVVAVGSAKLEPFIVSSFSSRGPSEEGVIKPDAVMFGEDISMASSKSDTAVTAKSGTSFATPFAAGMALLYHEAILAYHGVQYPRGVPPGLDPEITELISVRDLIDVYLARICVKPQGSEFGKDAVYGYGLPFGPLISDSLRQSATVDLATPMSALLMVNLMTLLMGAV